MQRVGDGAVLVHVIGHDIDDRGPHLGILGHAPPVERLPKFGVVVIDVLDLYGKRRRCGLLLRGCRLVLANQGQSDDVDLLSVELAGRPDHSLHLAYLEGVGEVVLCGLQDQSQI